MYNVVETTNLHGSQNISMQSTLDIENGFVVAKGDLINGETSIYTATIPTTTTPVYLVANPAWSYEDYNSMSQNEENFINKKGIAFRTYSLKKDNKFKVYDYGITHIDEDTDLAIGQFVSVDGTTYKLKASATSPDNSFVGKIINIEELGFPYCVGQFGVPVTIGGVSMGNTIDTRVTKVTIEVIKNS